MTADPVRRSAQSSLDPVVHELPPVRVRSELVEISLIVRRTEDASFRGRIAFGDLDAEGQGPVETAEIFCADTEDELWQAVRGLREHHLRDLYRSVTE